MNDNDLLQKVVSLCKRRGFIFQSSEIYGGLKSAYDYGPLGAELKRNISLEWWREMVQKREDVVGIDASIMMHPRVWEASGHLSGFSDPLVDCNNCKERFRADKAPVAEKGTQVTYRKSGKKDGEVITGTVGEQAYLCPVCGSCDFSPERQFNLMFRSSIGPVDAIEDFVAAVDAAVKEGKALDRKSLRSIMDEAAKKSAIFLRPETAQAMFVQFQNVQQSMSMKVPFGIAQIGKAFRNEIKSEKFIFRTCEFEQMEIEFFCEPGTHDEWMSYWVDARMKWWQSYSNNPEKFMARKHEPDELAHYATGCYDIEYQYPWGFDELEGVASRTDYDLQKHSEYSGSKLTYFDQNKNDPETGKPGWRYTPYVIEPSAGLTRGTLVYLLDAYTEESGVDAKGEDKTRVVMKFHPRLAPFKAAILPLMKKNGQPEAARELVDTFLKAGINVSYDEQQSIGKRYARHDEIGTPYCITIDQDTIDNKTVTIRDRDTTEQIVVPISETLGIVQKKLA
jgi:glycyl-tRNA synthetase